MFSGVAKSFFVIGFCSACGFLCTVIVQNKLPVQEAGRYVLLLTIVQVFAVMTPLGYEKLLRRYFSNFNVGEYAWRKIIKFVLLRALPLIALGLVWCRYQYRLTWFEFALAGLAVASYVVSLLKGSILQSMEKFGLSAWAIGGHRAILFVIIAVVLLFLNRPSLIACEAAIAVSFLITAILAGYFCMSHAPEGSKSIPKPFRRESFFFFATAISAMIYTYTDRMIIPIVLGEEDLARYFAVYNPFLVFDMAAMALGAVFIVKLARKDAQPSGYAFRLICLAGIGYIACVLTFSPLIHLLYNGRYDDARYLIPLIGLTKSLNIVLVFPTSMLGGRLGRKALATFAMTNLALTPLNVILVYILARDFALSGVALGMLAISVQWNVVGFGAVFAFSGTRSWSDASTPDPERNKA